MKYLSSKDAITFIEPGKKFIIVSSSDLNYKDIYLNRNSITYDELSQILENRKAPLYEYDGFSIKAYASSTRISYNNESIDTDIRIFKSLKEKVSGLFNKEDVFDAIKNYVNFLKKVMACGLSSKEKSKLIECIITGDEIIDDNGDFYVERKVESAKYFELKINSSTDIELHDSTQHTMSVFLKCDLSDKKDDRSEEHTSELQSPDHLVCRLLLETNKKRNQQHHNTTYHTKHTNTQERRTHH